jgi:hypothetical protein
MLHIETPWAGISTLTIATCTYSGTNVGFGFESLIFDLHFAQLIHLLLRSEG